MTRPTLALATLLAVSALAPALRAAETLRIIPLSGAAITRGDR